MELRANQINDSFNCMQLCAFGSSYQGNVKAKCDSYLNRLWLLLHSYSRSAAIVEYAKPTSKYHFGPISSLGVWYTLKSPQILTMRSLPICFVYTTKCTNYSPIAKVILPIDPRVQGLLLVNLETLIYSCSVNGN